MNIATIGIDLAKNVFQLHGVNGHGKVVLRRKIHRGQMRGLFINLPIRASPVINDDAS